MAETDSLPAPFVNPEPRFIAPGEAALILGLQILLLAFRLGDIPLLGPDEPRYARVAVEMARANEFVTPTLAGEPWLEKPPLYYWLAGLAYRFLGETEFAARLPAAFAALLMTAFTGLVAARLFGRSCGRTAMLILATSPLIFAYGRAATMDTLLAAFITGASGLLILSVLGIAGPSAVPAAWALMGVAALAKGPIGLLIPLAIGATTAMALRRFDVARLISPLSTGLFILVAAPWFIGIALDQGRHFLDVFILNHNLQRFTSTIHNHPGPFYYYLPILLLAVFPWSGLVAAALPALKRLERRSVVPMIAWLGIPLVLFSLAGSKLPGYILPCLPPFAIVLALSARHLGVSDRRGTARATGLLGLILSATLLALTIRGMQEGEVWARSALAPALWAMATTFMISKALERARAQVIRVLSIGAAGFLLLLTLVAPPVLEAMESGRRLFLPAHGREVLVAGAWRTAWMAGYFYNDARVTDVGTVNRALGAVGPEPRLVLFGPAEWRQASRSEGFAFLKLADGPRGNVLVRVSRRPDS